MLCTDASRYAMGCALYQEDEDGFIQPIEFKSKAFAKPQQKLAAHDRECLALLYVLSSFFAGMRIKHANIHKDYSSRTDKTPRPHSRTRLFLALVKSTARRMQLPSVRHGGTLSR